MSAVTDPATVAQCLRVGAGFSQGDLSWIAERMERPGETEEVTLAVESLVRNS